MAREDRDENQRYVMQSLQTHLFFARLLKEHAYFLCLGIMKKDLNIIKKLEYFQNQFEKVLSNSIKLGDGVICECVLKSSEIITKNTLDAEELTQKLTGLPINMNITKMEKQLDANTNNNFQVNNTLINQVEKLNHEAENLIEEFIQLKKHMLSNIEKGQLFTNNLPSVYTHYIEEAEFYQNYLGCLENKEDLEDMDIKEIELFFNDIMKDHAGIILHLLDNSELKLMDVAYMFEEKYDMLIEDTENDIEDVTNNTIKVTNKYKAFKQEIEEKVKNSEVKSILSPLLLDHVLRELNQYLRLLKNNK